MAVRFKKVNINLIFVDENSVRRASRCNLFFPLNLIYLAFKPCDKGK
jgi:hypothetical protein